MVEHDELIQDLHEDLKEWIITRDFWSTHGGFQTLFRDSVKFANFEKNNDIKHKKMSHLLKFVATYALCGQKYWKNKRILIGGKRFL